MEVKGWVDNEGKKLRRECSRSRGVDSRKRRVDIIDFQGVFLAITTPFLFIPKKICKLKTLSLYYNHPSCLPNPTF